MPFCRSAQLTDLLALGPPTSSVPGVATLLASVSPKACKARETCCWSGSYSIPHCRNVSVLPKKLAVCDCDDLGPRVTTLPRTRLSACFRSSCRPTIKNHSRAPECWRWHGEATPRENPPVSMASRDPYIVLRNFPHTPGCFAFGLFVWQSNVDITHRISIEVSSTHVRDGNEERVFNSKNVFLTRNTE